ALLLDGDQAELDELEQGAERPDERLAGALGLEVREQRAQRDFAEVEDLARELVDVEAQRPQVGVDVVGTSGLGLAQKSRVLREEIPRGQVAELEDRSLPIARILARGAAREARVAQFPETGEVRSRVVE